MREFFETLKLNFLRKWRPVSYRKLEDEARITIYAYEEVARMHARIAEDASNRIKGGDPNWSQWLMVEDRENKYMREVLLSIAILKRKFPGALRGDKVANELGIL